MCAVSPVWSLGCLLFAMAFGYSPFECAFSESGDVRVVECSYLAVIGAVKFPKTHAYSQGFCDLIRCVSVVLTCSMRESERERLSELSVRDDANRRVRRWC